jgi:ABC-type multidrug transport system permease subunit
MTAQLATVRVLAMRGLNEVARVPGAAIPSVLAPTIFLFGMTSIFGSLTVLPGFGTDDYMSFILPVVLLQGAGFSGAATGVNLARDIEQGWFDRLLASPTPRPVLLAGLIASASVRALVPTSVLLAVAFALGAEFPGPAGLAVAVVFVCAFAAVAAAWSIVLALRFRTQAAAPLMQAGVFMAVLFTTSYAPFELLSGWLYVVATVNPVTWVIEAVRQGFVGESITWAGTWPGLAAVAGLGAVLIAIALRGVARIGR